MTEESFADPLYKGREQSQLKHIFLKRYLERVAIVTLKGWDEFVFVDGFTGPWQSKDPTYKDTSFSLAVNILRKVRRVRKEAGRNVRVRCIFVEQNRAAFQRLEGFLSGIEDMETVALHGPFEQHVGTITQKIGGAFSFCLIDPKGWTGFALQQIKPLLQLRGEVVINFMYNYVNRFIDHPDPKLRPSLDNLFGGHGWREEIEERIDGGVIREDAILETFQERLRRFSGYGYVTSTRILFPERERTFFYLVYGTRHLKGLREFRESEKVAVEEQERIRRITKYEKDLEATGQRDLFGASGFSGERASSLSFQEARMTRLQRAEENIAELLSKNKSLQFEALMPLLQIPLVWESDLKGIVKRMESAGRLSIDRFGKAGKTIKPCHLLKWGHEI